MARSRRPAQAGSLHHGGSSCWHAVVASAVPVGWLSGLSGSSSADSATTPGLSLWGEASAGFFGGPTAFVPALAAASSGKVLSGPARGNSGFALRLRPALEDQALEARCGDLEQPLPELA